MSHARQQIRNAAVDALNANAILAGRVIASRAIPIGERDLPIVCVYVRGERATQTVMDDTADSERIAQLWVDIHEQDTGSADEGIDSLAVVVETVMATSPYFSGGTVSAFLDATDIEANNTVSRGTGRARLIYSVRYVVAPDDPETIL